MSGSPCFAGRLCAIFSQIELAMSEMKGCSYENSAFKFFNQNYFRKKFAAYATGA